MEKLYMWTPPASPHKLLQEEIWRDPWKIFVCCIFCNLTKRTQAEPIFWDVIKKWPTPEKMSSACEKELTDMVSSLGLSRRRVKALRRMSTEYLSTNWEDDPTRLYGIGKYGSDSYMIFCAGRWREIEPKDHALNDYHNFLKVTYGVDNA